MLPGRKLFWDPDRCCHLGLQVKSVSRYWELTRRNGNRLGRGTQGINRREKYRRCHQHLLSPLAMEEESENRWSTVELGMRLGDWTWRNRGRSEDLQLASSFPGWRDLWISRECLLQLMCWARKLGGEDLVIQGDGRLL